MLCIILLVLTAVSASGKVVGGCGENFPHEMKRPSDCCKIKVKEVEESKDDEKDFMKAIKYCDKEMNTTATADAVTTKPTYECMEECWMTRLGFMKEGDSVIDKEKIMMLVHKYYEEDFHNAAEKSIDTCRATKFNSECPSGVDKMIPCFFTEMMKNCPAKYWTNDDECKQTLAYIEKCGIFSYDFDDDDDDDEDDDDGDED